MPDQVTDDDFELFPAPAFAPVVNEPPRSTSHYGPRSAARDDTREADRDNAFSRRERRSVGWRRG